MSKAIGLVSSTSQLHSNKQGQYAFSVSAVRYGSFTGVPLSGAGMQRHVPWNFASGPPLACRGKTKFVHCTTQKEQGNDENEFADANIPFCNSRTTDEHCAGVCPN